MALHTALHVLLLLPLIFFTTVHVAAASSKRSSVLTMGINYGRIANNLPPPRDAVRLMQSIGVGKVKIFDSDPEVLAALANTGLEVAITITNEELPIIASSQGASDQWVKARVTAHYPDTLINIINVGNEVLSNSLNQTLWYQILPAMQNVYSSLIKCNLHNKIKVATSSALNMLGSSYPPSAGSFRDDIAVPIMQPLLQFLSQTGSYFFLNVYPDAENSVQDGQLQYRDLLDAQLDAVASAMAKLGYPHVRLAISETGWPTSGDEDESGANVENARAYNQRLVKKMLAYPLVGTPLRPRTFVPTYIFSLFNENMKPGPTTERNWGLFYPSGEAVYTVDLTRSRGGVYANVMSTYASSKERNWTRAEPEGVKAHASVKGRNSTLLWCVANPKTSVHVLQAGLEYVCGVDPTFCNAIQPHRPCFHPNTPGSHASFAFHSYWLSMKGLGGSCNFNGAAIFTSFNPSYGDCKYP